MQPAVPEPSPWRSAVVIEIASLAAMSFIWLEHDDYRALFSAASLAMGATALWPAFRLFQARRNALAHVASVIGGLVATCALFAGFPRSGVLRDVFVSLPVVWFPAVANTVAAALALLRMLFRKAASA